jgi:hypothetical protein
LFFFPRLRPSLSLLVLASVFSNMKVVELQLSWKIQSVINSFWRA